MPALATAGRIGKLEILHFKSYKFHQVVGPFKDFAAILAANGTQRGDLVGAISFILGVRTFRLNENHSQRDVDTKELAEQRTRIAFVKLVYITGSGEEIKFGRKITNSGTSEYRINNIPVAWDTYNNTMKGLDLLGEFEPDAFKDNSKQQPGARVSEPVAAPEELKKIHVNVENQKARAEERMIPTHQKRMLFAKQHNLEREKTLERDAALRHRAELDLKAAEARMKVDFNGNMESLAANIERTASDFEAHEQNETARADATRKAAIEAAAEKWKRKSANQPSSRPPSRPISRPTSRPPSRPTSPAPTFDIIDAASDELKVPRFAELTRSKSRFNGTNGFDVPSSKATDDHQNETHGVFPHVNDLNRVDLTPVETRSRRSRRRGDAETVPVAELATGHGRTRSRQRNGSLDGTISPMLAEERRQEARGTPRRADRASWPSATTPPHVLRTLKDYDDQLYWSNSVEDHLNPEKDNLIKAEELAEELYRDAMEMHNRLVAEEEMNAVNGKGHTLIAETKETCGDIMYAQSHEALKGRADIPVVTPLLIPVENSESRSVSFSHTLQCSDTPGIQTERGHLEGAVPNFGSQSAGSTEEPKGGDGMNGDGDHHLTNGFVDRTGFEKELAVLRKSNVRKQAKIDSLQKWRAYYQMQLEEKDLVHAKEMKKKDKAMKKTEKAHVKDIATRDARREVMEEKLRSDIKELNLVIEELSGQLYDMEEHLAAGGIPYKPAVNENTGPSSKTLLSAVIGVKEAVHTFSRTFMSYLKQHLTKARDLDEQICLESEVIVARPSDYKFLVQSFILRRMFLDFDSECFNIDSCMTEIFDIEEHSRACFQEYITHRNVSDTVTLLTDNRPHNAFLREFCFKKFLHIVSESTEEAFFGDFNHSDDICAGRHPSSRFYESYCRLAVSVWLLHRLAFSFQPPARMISVRKGAQFNPTYMESAVPGISSDALGDDGAALPFEALVGLVVHPGFRVGSSVIRAQVYLVTT